MNQADECYCESCCRGFPCFVSKVPAVSPSPTTPAQHLNELLANEQRALHRMEATSSASLDTDSEEGARTVSRAGASRMPPTDTRPEHLAQLAAAGDAAIRESARVALGLVVTLRAAINTACQIIETGDDRLLASDGPAGGQPPALTLAEWRRLYKVLDATRRTA